MTRRPLTEYGWINNWSLSGARSFARLIGPVVADASDCASTFPSLSATTAYATSGSFIASCTRTASVNSSLVRSGVFALAAKFSAMVSPRFVISAVRLCCCWRNRIKPTMTTVRTTSDVMSKTSLARSDSLILMPSGDGAARSSVIPIPLGPHAVSPNSPEKKDTIRDPHGKKPADRVAYHSRRRVENLPDGVVGQVSEDVEKRLDHLRIPVPRVRLP